MGTVSAERDAKPPLRASVQVSKQRSRSCSPATLPPSPARPRDERPGGAGTADPKQQAAQGSCSAAPTAVRDAADGACFAPSPQPGNASGAHASGAESQGASAMDLCTQPRRSSPTSGPMQAPEGLGKALPPRPARAAAAGAAVRDALAATHPPNLAATQPNADTPEVPGETAQQAGPTLATLLRQLQQKAAKARRPAAAAATQSGSCAPPAAAAGTAAASPPPPAQPAAAAQLPLGPPSQPLLPSGTASVAAPAPASLAAGRELRKRKPQRPADGLLPLVRLGRHSMQSMRKGMSLWARGLIYPDLGVGRTCRARLKKVQQPSC